MSDITVGARDRAGTHALTGGRRERAGRDSSRPLPAWAFTAFAVASFGGPLALAASGAPSVVGDAAGSSGLVMLAGAVVFLVPLAIWLRYSREVTSSGGLFAFVEEAAGRRVALVQAAIWIFSYLLYVVYTTVQIVYDLLPSVLPGEGRYQTVLALAIPVALVAVMLAGRAATFLVFGVIAAGQLALAGILDGVTLAHLSTPLSSFGTGAGTQAVAKASAQTSLLYVCGSLPLFLGGELAAPAQRTIRRGRDLRLRCDRGGDRARGGTAGLRPGSPQHRGARRECRRAVRRPRPGQGDRHRRGGEHRGRNAVRVRGADAAHPPHRTVADPADRGGDRRRGAGGGADQPDRPGRFLQHAC